MIGQKTFGITNKLSENLFVFMYEYDNTELKFVEFDAKLLSNYGKIDIYILQSSQNNYHLVSFDLISRELLVKLQNMVTIEGDYSRLQDNYLYFNGRGGFNVLRLGAKKDKNSPMFIDVIKHKNSGKSLKSLQHYKLYRHFCNIPFMENKYFCDMPTRLIVYKTRLHKDITEK